MLIVISPAKTLDYKSTVPTRKFTQPEYLDESEKLVKALRKFTADEIADMMRVSSNIAELNFGRYLNWDKRFSPENARQAIYAFKGDVYTGLDVQEFNSADLDFAQKHLRILSGLYGLLRPLDLMQPYRLEMGTKLKNTRGADLYDFWSEQVSEAIKQAIKSQRGNVLVNLASNEYFKVLDQARIDAKVITPVFRDYKNGKYKVLSFFAKKARGLMTSYIIRERLKAPEELHGFKAEGYRFSAKDSDDETMVFLRKQN